MNSCYLVYVNMETTDKPTRGFCLLSRNGYKLFKKGIKNIKEDILSKGSFIIMIKKDLMFYFDNIKTFDNSIRTRRINSKIADLICYNESELISSIVAGIIDYKTS